jgi:hypothetical protein
MRVKAPGETGVLGGIFFWLLFLGFLCLFYLSQERLAGGPIPNGGGDNLTEKMVLDSLATNSVLFHVFLFLLNLPGGGNDNGNGKQDPGEAGRQAGVWTLDIHTFIFVFFISFAGC